MMATDSQAHGNDGSGATRAGGLIQGASRSPPQAVSKVMKASEAGVSRPGLVPASGSWTRCWDQGDGTKSAGRLQGRIFFHDPQAS